MAKTYLLAGSCFSLSVGRFHVTPNCSICSGEGPGTACVDSGSRSRHAGLGFAGGGAAAAASAEDHLLAQIGVDCRESCDTLSCRNGRATSRQLAIVLCCVVAQWVGPERSSACGWQLQKFGMVGRRDLLGRQR